MTQTNLRRPDNPRPPRRLEDRTPNTADCPDAIHQHVWRRRRPELTEDVDRRVAYDADARGGVQISEEALAQLLRMAGFEPTEPGRCRWSEARQRWEHEISPGVSKEACGHGASDPGHAAVVEEGLR